MLIRVFSTKNINKINQWETYYNKTYYNNDN